MRIACTSDEATIFLCTGVGFLRIYLYSQSDFDTGFLGPGVAIVGVGRLFFAYLSRRCCGRFAGDAFRCSAFSLMVTGNNGQVGTIGLAWSLRVKWTSALTAQPNISDANCWLVHLGGGVFLLFFIFYFFNSPCCSISCGDPYLLLMCVLFFLLVCFLFFVLISLSYRSFDTGYLV